MGQFEQLLQFFKVLGNESRLKILGLLANGERSVGELAALLDLKEPTVSHHLAALKELELVGVRAEGNTRIYWLDAKRLESMNRDIFTPQNMAALVADDEEGDPFERKVLQQYIIDGRLKEIPLKRKKRAVLLRWLVEKFEAGEEYYELDLNEMIKEYHPDASALRRYMVEEGLMARDNRNMYWRI